MGRLLAHVLADNNRAFAGRGWRLKLSANHADMPARRIRDDLSLPIHRRKMKDNLDRYIERIENLPVTPTILVKLITVFRKQDRDVDEIVELMGQDPALTAEVLRYANSSYFGHEE